MVENMNLVEPTSHENSSDVACTNCHTKRKNDLQNLLMQWQPSAGGLFEGMPDDLVEYARECCNVEATKTLWSEIDRLVYDTRSNAGKRCILHRRSYLVLNDAPDLKDKNLDFDVLCTEHVCVFRSAWRYLCSRSLDLSKTCPFCEIASGGVKGGHPPTTPAMLDAQLLEAKRSYRIVTDELPVLDRYRKVGYADVLTTRCVLPHRMSATDAPPALCNERKLHKVGNIRTYLSGEQRSIRCLGPCNSSKRVANKWISPEIAQARIDQVSTGFKIDDTTYKKFSVKCVITHIVCGHRHMIPPIAFEGSPKCDVCDYDPGPVNAWHRVETLEDYDRYLNAHCSRELDPESRDHNSKIFARRFEKGTGRHEIYLRCKNHPGEKKPVRLMWATRTRGGCCIRSSADSKVKYTAAFLSPLLAKIEIEIDKEKSVMT